MSELTGRELDAAVARELFLRDVQLMGDTWLQWPRNAPTADRCYANAERDRERFAAAAKQEEPR